jgi:glycerol-3-phosphate dehydrogenase
MNRSKVLQELSKGEMFDILIIGGGATGLGAALDAASRGYRTALLEANDFAQGTSSRSTKLVHGGVRYLAQGNIKLVKEALLERSRLLQNAPHVCHTLPFVVPTFGWMQKLYYGTGLKAYDILAGKHSLGSTHLLSKKNTLDLLHGLSSKNLSGGVCYYDGQFDDARLAIDIARTAAKLGCQLLNHARVISLTKKMGRIVGAEAVDTITGNNIEVAARVVINATGVYADDIIEMDEPDTEKIVSPSQGIHLVIDAVHFPCDAALMIPKTDDGRVLFAVPWYDKVIIGTTDTPLSNIKEEPTPLASEVDFVLNHANRYFKVPIQKEDVRSCFAGLRPLVKQKGVSKTALLNRDHTLFVSKSGMVTVTGGKWTTYRKMAEDAVNNAIFSGKMQAAECITANLHISEPGLQISDKMEFDYDAICYFIQHEMAETVEDILCRRTRLLFLDAKRAIDTAPQVALHLAAVLEKGVDWQQKQVQDFNMLASQYMTL